MVRCGDAAPDATYKMLPCSECGGEFPHKGKGRPPKMCPWARQEVENRPPVIREKRGIAVPIFEEISSDVSIGDLVYRLTDSYNNEVVKRRFATEYQVSRVFDDGFEVIRTAKNGYKNYPIPVNSSYKFFTRVGTEYLELVPDETLAEDEE